MTWALTDGRYQVDRTLGGADVIIEVPGAEAWRFNLGVRDAEVTICPGHVLPGFLSLGRAGCR